MPKLPAITIEDLLSAAGALRVGIRPVELREEYYRVNLDRDLVSYGGLFLGAVARGMARRRGKECSVALDEDGVAAIRLAAEMIEDIKRTERVSAERERVRGAA